MATSKRKRKKKPTTIDAILAGVKGDRRKALDSLRRTIRKIVPKAKECLSYGLAAFELDGEIVAGFAATAKGCSYYPFSGRTLRTMKGELEGYTTTPGALHFDPKKGLPVKLVRKLISTRRAEL
jgi:uncharacterized protein YdhG (YjbR/CyaY superfamily)